MQRDTVNVLISFVVAMEQYIITLVEDLVQLLGNQWYNMIEFFGKTLAVLSRKPNSTDLKIRNEF